MAGAVIQRRRSWFQVGRPLSPKTGVLFGVLSFVLPVLAWCVVSYVPFVWHPKS